MKIRSVTAFVHLSPAIDIDRIDAAARIAIDAKSTLEERGYEVQSIRLATNPISEYLGERDEKQAIEMAKEIEAAALEAGFGFISLGPVLAEDAGGQSFIAPMLANTSLIFLGASLNTIDLKIHPAAIKSSANAIKEISTIDANGFANLRFATLANVGAGSPFFPAAYHLGEEPSFAFATQAADMAVRAFQREQSLVEGASNLTKEIEREGQKLGAIGKEIAEEQDIQFGGIDFSLAPFPEDSDSLGYAMEKMGVPSVGMNGSLTAAAILTSAIQAADYPRTGFNGLLLPPLEDSVLAKRAADGVLTVNDLLLYSAVCGTGLDTVPLAGDISVETLEAILMDVTALALRLDKPLTARLMPIPGKIAGDKTDFEFDFFANSRVMAATGQGLKAPLSDSAPFSLLSR